MFKKYWLILLLNLFSFSLTQTIEGTTFSHEDWLLVCDNSGTCRASGYQPFDQYIFSDR